MHVRIAPPGISRHIHRSHDLEAPTAMAQRKLTPFSFPRLRRTSLIFATRCTSICPTPASSIAPVKKRWVGDMRQTRNLLQSHAASADLFVGLIGMRAAGSRTGDPPIARSPKWSTTGPRTTSALRVHHARTFRSRGICAKRTKSIAVSGVPPTHQDELVARRSSSHLNGFAATKSSEELTGARAQRRPA